MNKISYHFFRITLFVLAYGHLNCSVPPEDRNLFSYDLQVKWQGRLHLETIGLHDDPTSRLDLVTGLYRSEEAPPTRLPGNLQYDLDVETEAYIRRNALPTLDSVTSLYLRENVYVSPTILATNFTRSSMIFPASSRVKSIDQASEDFFESSPESTCTLSAPLHDECLFIEPGQVFRSCDAGFWRIEMESNPENTSYLSSLFYREDPFRLIITGQVCKLPNSFFSSKTANRESHKYPDKLCPSPCARLSVFIAARNEEVDYILLKKIKNNESDVWSYFDGFANSTDRTFFEASVRVTQEDSDGIFQKDCLWQNYYVDETLVLFPHTSKEHLFMHRVYFERVEYVDLSENQNLTWVSSKNLKDLLAQLKESSLEDVRFHYRYFTTDIKKRNIRLANLFITTLRDIGALGPLEK